MPLTGGQEGVGMSPDVVSPGGVGVVGAAPPPAAAHVTLDSSVQVPYTPSMIGRTRHQRSPKVMPFARVSLSVGVIAVAAVVVSNLTGAPCQLNCWLVIWTSYRSAPGTG